MKTLLFGLATAAACASAPQQKDAQYPLCDHAGSPACGNIGQVGRAAPTPVITQDAKSVFAASATAPAISAAAPATPPRRSCKSGPAHPSAAQSVQGAARAAAVTATTVVPKVTRVLVGASQQITTVSPLVGPRMDHREQVVCGNVMSKGGSRRVCRDASGSYVDPNTAFAPGQVVESSEIGE